MEGVIFLVMFVLFGGICVDIVGASQTYDVTSFGAVGDGRTDDSQHFLSAWASTCKDASSPTFVIPEGKTFLLNQITFEGPCQSSIHVQVGGNLVAPSNMWRPVDPNNWITFMHVQDLTIDGSGQIDGQGSSWWNCVRAGGCPDAPDALAVFSCNNVRVSGIHIINSPAKHFNIYKCAGASVNGITISSPGVSPNTDGIHIQESQQVQITGSNIASGDDCISIGEGSSDVNISHIACGPGHGIRLNFVTDDTDLLIDILQVIRTVNLTSDFPKFSSIGSLGMNRAHDEVQQIHVSFCSFVQTSNGARIKTWQGGSGFARGITFEHLTFQSVQYPILIDQYYCMSSNCPDQPGAVQISDVSFIDLRGTTSGHVPVTLNCSRTVGCTGLVLQDVNIQGGLSSSCINAHGKESGTISPAVPCLLP